MGQNNKQHEQFNIYCIQTRTTFFLNVFLYQNSMNNSQFIETHSKCSKMNMKDITVVSDKKLLVIGHQLNNHDKSLGSTANHTGQTGRVRGGMKKIQQKLSYRILYCSHFLMQ